jgi:protocatechuate 4,5-dioxygenase beta chain
MAQLIGCIGTSHIPAIGGAIHKGMQQDPYWKPFFDGFPADSPVAGREEARCHGHLLQRPRSELLPGQDAHLCRGRRARSIVNSDEGWGIPSLEPLKGEVDLSWHIINTLIDKEFDIVSPARKCWWTMPARCR